MPQKNKINDIVFNRPHMSGNELKYVEDVLQRGHASGAGYYTEQCHAWLTRQSGCNKSLLTHSCTAGLEMAVLLADIEPGDEVIMPSYTFVSTANAVVLRGGIPVFVDIRHDTLNIDEKLLEAAITSRTRAIMVVHYAGVGCEMDSIMALAKHHELFVIEDAAQGVMAAYKGRALGSIGHFGAYSFHETKNVISGEGGALLVNDVRFGERAEILWEKGTNRTQFFRGEVDKYSWVDVGSSFLPSDIIAAFLLAQLEKADSITQKRLEIYGKYHAAFAGLESRGLLRRPVVPEHCTHNAHMYYLLLPDSKTQVAMLSALKSRGIHAVFHYVPLHDSIGGRRFARTHGSLNITCDVSARLIRLPLWIDLLDTQIQYIIDVTCELVVSS